MWHTHTHTLSLAAIMAFLVTRELGMSALGLAQYWALFVVTNLQTLSKSAWLRKRTRPPSMTVGRFTISVPRPDGPGSLRASSALLATIPSSTNFSSTSPSHFLGQEPRKAIHKIPQGRECSGLASIHVGTLKQFIPKDCCCDVVPHINDESLLQKNYVGLYWIHASPSQWITRRQSAGILCFCKEQADILSNLVHHFDNSFAEGEQNVFKVQLLCQKSSMDARFICLRRGVGPISKWEHEAWIVDQSITFPSFFFLFLSPTGVKKW